MVGTVDLTYLGPSKTQNMSLALKQPLPLRALLVDLVDVYFLVPASDREEVVHGRELQVGYAV